MGLLQWLHKSSSLVQEGMCYGNLCSQDACHTVNKGASHHFCCLLYRAQLVRKDQKVQLEMMVQE